MMLTPNKIVIRGAVDPFEWAKMALLLERILPIEFVFSNDWIPGALGQIVFGEMAETRHSKAGATLIIPNTRSEDKGGNPRECEVRFVGCADVPFPFRGRTVVSKIGVEPRPLTLGAGEQPLAFSEGGVVWAVSSIEGRQRFRSSFDLPHLAPDGNFADLFNGDRLFELLPLIHWLRSIKAIGADQEPPLRACFIFDDPNLHWPHYGHVHYAELAARAAKGNYHVSFATIPLDTWFTHRPTANIFQANPAQLSLCIHGNNHLHKELSREYSASRLKVLLGQALGRIERLEAKTGLAVSRVMVPPHGACSQEILAALPAHGFQAACISHGSLRAHNQRHSWTRDLGFARSERIGGCPVFARWALSENCTNSILAAAFLRQPIVLRGHHRDLKDGVELLDELAAFVNGLGPVAWSNMADLCRESQRSEPEIGAALPDTEASVKLEAARPLSRTEPPLHHTGTRPGLWVGLVAFVRRLLTESRDRFW